MIKKDKSSLFARIERADVVFRIDMSTEQREMKMPFIAMDRKEFEFEENTILSDFDINLITEDEAYAQIKELMVMYYNKE